MRSSALARQHIVALTQTEIMFVLAAIFLILLQFKQHEFETAMAGGERAAEPAQLAVSDGGGQPSARAQPELDKEVKDVLNRPEQDASERGDEDAANIESASDEFDPDAEVKEILVRAQASGAVGAEGSRDERVDELVRLAAVGRQAESLLEADKPLPESNPNPTAQSGAEDDPEGSKVGFDPCWERITPKGNISYYKTFETKYDLQNDVYMISPAWDEAVPVVRAALEGPLALLNRHPEGWITPERYAEYVVRVRDLAEELYSPGCRLVTMLDEPTRRSIKQIAPYLYPIVK